MRKKCRNKTLFPSDFGGCSLNNFDVIFGYNNEDKILLKYDGGLYDMKVPAGEHEFFLN